MPPCSPGANAVTKTSGSAAATGRGTSIMARAARAKARARRSVVIGNLLGVGTAFGQSSLDFQLPSPLYLPDDLRHRQPGIDVGRAFADTVLDVGHVPLRIEVGRQGRIALLIEARRDAGPLVSALVEAVGEVGLQ